VDLPRHGLLLFDGECGVCSWLALRARRIDGRGRFGIRPYQEVAEADLAPWRVTHADCARSLQLLLGRPGRPRRHGGAFAVNAFLWRFFPWSLGVALLYLLPPLLVLEIVGYRLVAAHRARVSRLLGLSACRPESMTRPDRVE
jgi:predicted DCC family thiol-disulfide oxidoreductase YuxK